MLSKDKLCNAFFCAFYINVCNLDHLEKLVYNQNDIKMVLGANTSVCPDRLCYRLDEHVTPPQQNQEACQEPTKRILDRSRKAGGNTYLVVDLKVI